MSTTRTLSSTLIPATATPPSDPVPLNLISSVPTDEYIVHEGPVGVPQFSAPGQWSIVNRFQTAVTVPLESPEEPLRFVSANPNLETALAIITNEKIQAHVNFLADDRLKGRDTPSEGLNTALDYVTEQLKKNGFTPSGVNGTYRYPWTGWGWGVFETEEPNPANLRGPAPHNSCTRLTLKDANSAHTFKYGQDYFYSLLQNTTDRDIEITGDVVLAGEGTKADFDKANVANKWVLVFDSPDISPAERRDLAIARGAKGLIIAPNLDANYPYLDVRREHQAALARENKLIYPKDAALDEITITKTGAERLTPLLMSNFKSIAEKSSPIGPTSLSLTDKRVLKTPFGQIKADNVLGLHEGSDPKLKNEVVLITAHIDHVGMQGDQVYNGADDNASGSSALMLLSEAIAKLHPGRSIMIMWVSGEEKGLLGSGAWAQNPSMPAGYKVVANINLDMIGRNAPEELHVTPSKNHSKYNDLVKITEAIAPSEGYPKLGNADNVYSRSDHYNFAKYLKVPIIFLTTGLHDDYHKPSDDAHKIVTDKIRRVSRLVVKLIDEMDRNFRPQILD